MMYSEVMDNLLEGWNVVVDNFIIKWSLTFQIICKLECDRISSTWN